MAMAVALAACGSKPGSGTSSEAVDESDSLAIRQAIMARLPLTITDGTAARGVRDRGLFDLLSVSDSQTMLFWPAHSPLRGPVDLAAAFADLSQGEAGEMYWQPLLLKSGGGLGLVAGVLAVQGGLSLEGGLELGRYLAVWHVGPEGNRLRAFLPAQVGVARISDSLHFTRAVDSASVPLPTGIAAADSSFRDRLFSSGPSVAFGEWYAEDGFSFATGGTIGVGPDAIERQLAGAGNSATWVMRPIAGGSSTDDALAWVAGRLTITPTGAPPLDWNYLMFWERKSGGEYRIVAVLTNPGVRPMPEGHAASSSRGPK